MYLSHILYGSVTRQQGGLLLTSRGAGERGLLATYNCSSASVAQPTVSVESSGQGEGHVEVQIPPGTTVVALLNALRASAGFSLLFYADYSGDPLAPAAASAEPPVGPTGGLLQHLVGRLGIAEWANREQITTGIVQALLWPAWGKVVRQSPERDGLDEMEGMLELSVAAQLNSGFHAQNELLDTVRRRVFQCFKRFSHPWLTGLGPASWTYSNVLKSQAAGVQREEEGQPAEAAELNVLFSIPIQWTEQAFDPDQVIFAEFKRAQIGLFREPLTDPLGPDGGEVLDELLIITAEED